MKLVVNMSKNYLEHIKLNHSQVHVKNPERVNEIITNLVCNGFDKLQVVSDFDGTITKQHSNGKMHMSSFAMFQQCPSLPKEYAQRANELTNKFYPIEIDPNLSVQEKIPFMVDWWNQSEVILEGAKVSRQEIEEVCRKLSPTLRDGYEALFKELLENEVPILVFSAGLGDVVEAVLKICDCLLPNVKVISNFLKYDSNGVIQGFQDKIIHVFNKNEEALKGSDFHDLVVNRENVLLMGDSIGDATMAEGIEHKNVLKIGFLYENSDENLPTYLEHFDMVLVDDQTMAVPKFIMDLIKNYKIPEQVNDTDK